MPKLWDETIAEHRQAVREATMATTARLVAEDGLRSVTMSQIAAETGIGRATLYKYFPDVEAILIAWHREQVRQHLAELVELGGEGGSAGERLAAVLEAYALIQYRRALHAHASTEVAALVHRDPQLHHAYRELDDFVKNLVGEAARAGEVRDDIAPDELTGFCLSALAGATSLRSKAAVQRLVEVTLTGLRAGAE
jgi:AcrR family transcriptional regulator